MAWPVWQKREVWMRAWALRGRGRGSGVWQSMMGACVFCHTLQRQRRQQEGKQSRRASRKASRRQRSLSDGDQGVSAEGQEKASNQQVSRFGWAGWAGWLGRLLLGPRRTAFCASSVLYFFLPFCLVPCTAAGRPVLVWPGPALAGFALGWSPWFRLHLPPWAMLGCPKPTSSPGCNPATAWSNGRHWQQSGWCQSRPGLPVEDASGQRPVASGHSSRQRARQVVASPLNKHQNKNAGQP